MKSFLFLLLILPSTASFAQVKTSVGTQEEFVYPLYSHPTDSFEDLLPLENLLKDRTLIGMGEATHGTKEFFESKARFFKFLVLHCNYKVFGIEDTYGGCSYINDFVRTGLGNIDSVMLHFDFWTWKTEEVKELILWMKDYNQLQPASEKISFYGFDMQNYYAPIKYLDDFFKSDSSKAAAKINIIANLVLKDTEFETYKKLQKKELRYRDTLETVCDQLQDILVANQAYLTQKYSPAQYERLSCCIQNSNQAVANLSVTNISKFRDSCMAANILQVLKVENKKMFVWAHNGHINLNYPDKVSDLMGLPMGGCLKNTLGAQYFAIGFVFNQGDFQAIKGPNTLAGAFFKYVFARKKLYKGLQACTVPVNSKNTFTNALSRTGFDAYFMDINSSMNDVFSTDLKTYDIGAVFLNYKRCSDTINAKKQFDGLIYFDQTSRAMPLKPK